MADNWVVYHFKDLEKKKYTMGVLELFEKDREKRENPVLSALSFRKLTKTSAYNRPQLDVLSQVFFTTGSIRTMDITRTLRGESL